MRKPQSELRQALGSCRGAFVFAGVFGFFINTLMLVPSLYMMQVYDRVLGSGNEVTLLMLTLITLGLMVVMGILDYARSRVLVRVSMAIDKKLSNRLFDAVFLRYLRLPRGPRAQPLSDLNTVRQFLTGHGLFAFLDLPWIPLFLGLMFLFHPLLGLLAVAGGVVLVGLTIANEMSTSGVIGQSNVEYVASSQFVDVSLRNAEVVEAMGMLHGIRNNWNRRHGRVLALQAKASDKAGIYSNATKTFRIALQSMMLGMGGWLAVRHQITPGTIIAASIIGSKALAPIEMVVGSWSSLIATRVAYRRLEALLEAIPPHQPGMELPPPKGDILVEQVVAVPPGGTVPVIKGISFAIAAGETIGIIGPSAAGKSSLARLLVGVWLPYNGAVRLDGADIKSWPRDKLGPYIGYLPQDIELFDGTVSENIARFSTIDAAAVIEAATKAGIHEMILRLPQGYDTPIGEAGGVLSGGQRQRMGLARALYGNPSFLVFDEPNSNLDEIGEAALIEAIRGLKQAGKTVVIIAHRPSVLAHVDKIMVMRDGMIHMYGPRNEVLAKVTRPTVVSNVGSPGPAVAAPGAGPAQISN